MKRSRKSKSPLSLELVRELDQLLHRFRESPNFEMLSKLPVTHFLTLPAGRIGKLAELSLGRIVEIGAAKTCGLPGMTAADAQDLKGAIERLCAETATGSSDERGGGGDDESSAKAVKFFASSEAEIRLSQALQRLKAADRFESIEKRTLGEFWTESARRSPFEECITFKQLAEMNLESFLRKKSFTAARIDAMMGAIENCLSFVSAVPEEQQETRQIKKMASPVDDPALNAWIAESADMPSHLAAGVLYLVSELGRAAGGSKALWSALTDLTRHMSAREIGILWLMSEHSDDVVVDLFRADAERIRAIGNAAKEKLVTLLDQRCPEAIAHIRSALSSPGIPRRDLFAPHRGGVLRPELEESIFSIVLGSLGASPVIAFGTTVDGVVTAVPGAFELIMTGLLANLPKDDSRVRSEAKVLLPFVDTQLVIDLLARRAKFNSAKSRWEP